jgi:hypothetical protein
VGGEGSTENGIGDARRATRKRSEMGDVASQRRFGAIQTTYSTGKICQSKSLKCHAGAIDGAEAVTSMCKEIENTTF